MVFSFSPFFITLSFSKARIFLTNMLVKNMSRSGSHDWRNPDRASRRACAAVCHRGDDEVSSQAGHLALYRGGLRLYFLRVARSRRALSVGRRVAAAYMPPGAGSMVGLSPRTPAFQITTQPGILVRDGLPGPSASAPARTISRSRRRRSCSTSAPARTRHRRGERTARLRHVVSAGVAALRQRRQEI